MSAAAGRSVRTSLAMVAAFVLVVYVALGVLLSLQTWNEQSQQLHDKVAYASQLTAETVDESFDDATSGAENLAEQPGTADGFTSTICSLQLGAVGAFPEAHLDFVHPDGRIACTSATSALRQLRGVPWLAEALRSTSSTISDLYDDPLTGQRAVAIARPVTRPGGGVLGLVVIVLPIKPLVAGLTGTYGGSEHTAFAVTDRHGLVLSRLGTPRGAWATEPLGSDSLQSFASTSVGLRLWAGLPRSLATDAARSALERYLVLGMVTFTVAVLAMAVLYRRYAAPIRRLTRAVQQLGRNVQPEPLLVTGPRELAILADEINELAATRHESEQRLGHQTLHDALTGLPNRSLLLDRLGQLVASHRRSGQPGGLLFMDLDHFKRINDTVGHSAGDRALRYTAHRLGQLARPGDTLARFSGDEFVLVCPDATEEQLLNLAADVLRAITQSSTDELPASISIGVAVLDRDADAEELLRRGDTALHRAKELGRGQVETFSPELSEAVSSRVDLESRLRAYLETRDIEIHYQPVVDLRSGAEMGMEALVRWNDRTLGPVPPTVFIPVAEEAGLIGELGHQVLRAALTFAASRPGSRLAVNVSVLQLADTAFPAAVKAALKESRMAPERLTLELTESVLVSDPQAALLAMRSLKKIGVRLSIDDFGTGYSSLAYLNSFPFDELKIDRSFVTGLHVSNERHSLVAAIVAMAAALDLEVVAEGVEYEAEAEALRALGCIAAQGYFFGRPVPAAAFGATRSIPEQVDLSS